MCQTRGSLQKMTQAWSKDLWRFFTSVNPQPMKIERIRKVLEITQNDLADFLGISRSAVSMHERNQRTLSHEDSQCVDALFEAIFRPPEPYALEVLERLQQEHAEILQAETNRQLARMQVKIEAQELALQIALNTYQKLQNRLMAILHFEESIQALKSDMKAIHFKWIEVQKLNAQLNLKNGGLAHIFKIELELHQLKSKKEFLESRLSK